MDKHTKISALGVLSWALLLAAAVYTIFPVITIAFESTRGQGFTLEWYRLGFRNAAFWSAFATSLLLSAVVGVVSTLIGLGSVRFVLRLSPRMRALAYITIALPFLLPVLVSGYALHAYFGVLGIDGTLLALVLAQVAYVSPIAFFLLNLSHSRLDSDVEECARNLGAQEFNILLEIVLPQLRVPLVFTLIVCALISWDEFVITWFVGGFHRTLPVLIYGMLGSTLDRSIYAFATFITVISIFMVALAVFVNRKNLSGSLGRQ